MIATLRITRFDRTSREETFISVLEAFQGYEAATKLVDTMIATLTAPTQPEPLAHYDRNAMINGVIYSIVG